MSIFPLPVFEADVDPARRDALTDKEVYEGLQPPKSIVVRFGALKLIGEFPYDGDSKPGCGSKLVVRTHRGTELAEMLTTTCTNSGCGKSVSRQEILEYIENSGGREFPFHTDGRILHVASVEELNRWSAMQAESREHLKLARRVSFDLQLPMKVVDVEPILGGETVTVYYLSEERIDFREMVRLLAAELQTRIEMRQVGARDEARIVADYERCGQHCCCKQFLKVLKPVSIKSAKVQKATLDPLKISGRCGRLMCCLRYEDQTYTELVRRLPKLRSRVGTGEGPGVVLETKILVQLVLVRLEHNGKEIAVPVEELMKPDECPQPSSADFARASEEASARIDPLRGARPERIARQNPIAEAPESRASDGPNRRQEEFRNRDRDAEQREVSARTPMDNEPVANEPASNNQAEKPAGRRSRRRRRRRSREAGAGQSLPGADESKTPVEPEETDRPLTPEGSATPSRRRRRRRRRPRSDGRPDADSSSGPQPD